MEYGRRHEVMRVQSIDAKRICAAPATAHDLDVRPAQVELLAELDERPSRDSREDPELLGDSFDHAHCDRRLFFDPLAEGGQRIHEEVRLDVPAQQLRLEPCRLDERFLALLAKT